MSDAGPPTPETRPLAVELTWSRSERAVPRVVLRPLQEFLKTSTSGAFLLFAAVIVALLWANSPWKVTYHELWLTRVTVGVGSWALDKDLRFWIDDGLMSLFFVLVGLEIKREVVSGELRDPRAATIPVLAAIGGMIVPALVYVAVAGRAAPGGWGVPMATDIAFALGVLTLAAAHAPPSLKSLLLTLAIVDDIGAILVIAVFYSDGVTWVWLASALSVAVLVVVSTRVRIRATGVYLLLGGALWYTTYRAGIHPTIAGVALGLMTPAHPFQRPAAVSEEAHRIADETVDDPQPLDADASSWLQLAWLAREAVSPLARVEHALLPWSSFVILPLFALANAGVTLSGGAVKAALTSVVSLGIVLGLVVGKPVGVLAATTIGVRARLGRLSADVRTGHVVGLGMTAGVGFTMGLFIAGLAFEDDPGLLAQAKIAILVASLIAGVVGYSVFRLLPGRSSGADPASQF
ncbi:MAG: Na+/H+ antiporter NhaA [Actinomycetota bacterium]